MGSFAALEVALSRGWSNVVRICFAIAHGDPNGIRTRVTAVKGQCPNRWTIGSLFVGTRDIGLIKGLVQGKRWEFRMMIFSRNGWGCFRGLELSVDVRASLRP